VIAFSILVEGFRQKSTPAVRHAQVRLVDTMLRYLRADAVTGEPTQHAPGSIEHEGTTAPPMLEGEEPADSESDGDPRPDGRASPRS